MPKFTKEQQQAIDQEGSNIIVSAGAGSGKTAVLSERVLRKLKEGVFINQLLILTFTNEAANEMKERIRKKVQQDATLSSQLDLIDSAYITTFDSFSLSMVKKYHYLLNVNKNISIIDSSIINIKKREFIDEIFDSLYEKQDDKFLKVITDFCVKDDKNIKEVVYNLNNDLDKLINKQEFLTNYVDKYYNESYLNHITCVYMNAIDKMLKNIEASIYLLEEIIETPSDDKKYQEIISIFEPLIKAKDYEEIKSYTEKDFKLLGKLSEPFKEEAKKLKEYFKQLKELTCYSSLQEVKEQILSTKDFVSVVISIIKELDCRLLSYKHSHDSYEFNDIAVMAIKLVEENEEIREEIKNEYNEILLDEYQDTSDLQEKFMSLIGNNNIYMVGDVKQSIYRFRNANPMIFKNKYDKYNKNDGGKKIDLVKNFRSRKEVLQNINEIFNLIMDDSIGGADYKESHQMQYGLTLYEEEDVRHDNHLEIYNYTLCDNKYTKEEVEAFLICKDIKKKIENGYLVFDKDTSKVRKATYSDFCIIMDRGSAFTTYKKIFEYLEVPLVLYMDQKLNNENDILVIKNIMNLIVKIKNREFDQKFRYYFISVARSYLSNLNDQDIFTIFKENTFKETEIYEKCLMIASSLDTLSNTEVLDRILESFSIYERTMTIGKIEDSFVRIDHLKNIASSLSSLGYSPIMFCEYLNQMNEGEDDIKYSLNNKIGDTVKIMNIHKSKGLEFPVCYFSGFHKKFNFRDVKNKFLFDNQYGIIFPYYKEGIGKTVLHKLVEMKYYQEEISEKIRLFYVALTRAREKMIIVTSLDEKKEILSIESSIKEKYRSFLDIMESLKIPLSNYIVNKDIENIGLTKQYDLNKNIAIDSMINKDTEKILIEDISFEKEIVKNTKASKIIQQLISYEDTKKLNIGTEIHYLFEVVDFKDLNRYKEYPCFSYIENFVKHLGNLSSSKIYKEYPFIYEKEGILYSGIIDLVIEYEDHVKIIDYKLKNIEDENYKKQLQIYKNFIISKTDKPVYTYLYSIINNTLKKVD